jgi:hypothetical protein
MYRQVQPQDSVVAYVNLQLNCFHARVPFVYSMTQFRWYETNNLTYEAHRRDTATQ